MGVKISANKGCYLLLKAYLRRTPCHTLSRGMFTLESDLEMSPTQSPLPLALRIAVQPTPGEVITSLGTGNSYTMGDRIGEGHFGVVYSCTDFWGNDLAAKVLKQPLGTPHEQIRAAAEAEFHKLLQLRHPYITYVFDAFEFRDAFYIITERCWCPLVQLFQTVPNFNGQLWLHPIARCLLQAVHYLHLNHYAHQDIHLGNVFAAFARNEMVPQAPGSIHFKLGDLGISKLYTELDAANTMAEWIRPPEAINPAEFGPLGNTIDIYHLGLLFLQLAHSRELRFSGGDILNGRPREMAAQLPPPLNFALEKALRRHALWRTPDAMELWRDLNVTQAVPPP